MSSNDINTYTDEIWKSLELNTSDDGIAIFMMGLPSSGKSTSIDIVLNDIGIPKDNIIHVDPDIFMNKIEGYNNARASNFNLSGVRIAREILKKINDSENKYNYIYYGTGKNYKDYLTIINKANKNEYRTILVNVELKLEEAIKRSKSRPRRVPSDIIKTINTKLRETHTRKIKKIKKELTNFEILSDKVDFVYTIDNNSSKAVINYKSSRNSNSNNRKKTKTKTKL